MREPTEREWLEGIGERFEREHVEQEVLDLCPQVTDTPHMSLTTTLLSYGAQCPNCHRTPTYGIFLRTPDGTELVCQDCLK